MKRFSTNKFFTLAIAFVLSGVSASFATPLETRSTSTRSKVSSPAKLHSDNGGHYGYILMDAATGQVLSHRNADTLFIPASLAKIPTTLMTLSALGTDRTFQTRLVTDAAIVDGSLQGDLHLVGSGDPSLAKRDIIELVEKLQAAGIDRVSGAFTYDASALPRTSVIDKAQPSGQSYNPAVSGLNIDLNIKVAGGKKTPVREPGLRAAQMFRYFAYHKGITMPEPSRSRSPVTGTDIASHESAPVSRILSGMMDRSTNLTAESLGLLSVASTGQSPKSMSDAALATSEWLKAEAGQIGGKGWSGFRMVNHSGLSTRSRATPRQIASILRLGYLRFGNTFTDMHKENRPGGYQAYSLRGKFGTMRFVRGYGGFLTVGGREMIFTIMTNDRRRRAMADAGATGLPSHAWMNRARILEQTVLGEWITDLWSQQGTAPIVTVQAPAVDPAPETPPFSTSASSVRSGAPQPDVSVSATTQTPFTISTLIAEPARYVRSTSLVE